MQLQAVKITAQNSDWQRISALYVAAFPENERRPLLPLLQDETGHSEIVAFRDGDRFCGFACLLTSGELTLVAYFAIEERLRGQGYGSAALGCIAALKPAQKLLVDIEVQDPCAENSAQRRRRKQFYLRSGFAETPVTYSWRGETYEILSYGGQVTKQDFHAFWRRLRGSSPKLLAD